jgi:hypothetical protein
MSSAPTAEEIARDARWLVQALDPSEGMVRLVAMDEASYRAASFLDDRLIQQPVDAQAVPWPDVQAAVAGDLRTDARWIFHIGHVGSTLVSRLLGELPSVLAVREPRLLRDLALSPPEVRERYIPAIPKVLSRTFAPNDTACVKATSFASEIASLLIPPGERALFMYARPLNYIASILAGENSVKELIMLADFRAKRLAERAIVLPQSRNDAEAAAAAWACEMVALESAAAEMVDRSIAWADFDSMLADMPSSLSRAADSFGIDADREEVEAIVSGPLMKLYSKDPAHEYSPMLRRNLIDQELRLQRRDIDGALAMLPAAAEKSPLLARALARAEG